MSNWTAEQLAEHIVKRANWKAAAKAKAVQKEPVTKEPNLRTPSLSAAVAARKPASQKSKFSSVKTTVDGVTYSPGQARYTARKPAPVFP